MLNREINRQFYKLGKIFFPILIGIWFFVIKEGEHLFEVVPSCVIYRDFGIYCPGCGFTRAVYYAMHFQIPESLRHSAFIVYSLTVYICYMLYYGIRKRRKKASKKEIPVLPFIFIGILILLVQWLWKNL